LAVRINKRCLSAKVTWVAFVAVSLFLSSCLKNPDQDALVVYSGATMGTTYSIKVAGFPEGLDREQIKAEIDVLLERINRSMSTYIPESEISQFNRFDSTSWFSVSAIMINVLTESIRVSALTNGAFDVTVAPLVNLWGFGAKNQTLTVPSDDIINLLKKKTGYRKIKVRVVEKLIGKRYPDLTIDLSAIAKGFAVDQVGDHLENRGLKNYLVEIGGEIRTSGFKGSKTRWIVGIERPKVGERVIHQVIAMGDYSMATSGDYRNYFEKDGERFSHLIDPQSGKPINHKLASVSVIHRSCMTADAFATAFMVLGPAKAYQVALDEKLAAYFLIRGKTGFDVKMTPAFRSFLIKN